MSVEDRVGDQRNSLGVAGIQTADVYHAVQDHYSARRTFGPLRLELLTRQRSTGQLTAGRQAGRNDWAGDGS
jgi:hypothetical protein